MKLKKTLNFWVLGLTIQMMIEHFLVRAFFDEILDQLSEARIVLYLLKEKSGLDTH